MMMMDISYFSMAWIDCSVFSLPSFIFTVQLWLHPCPYTALHPGLQLKLFSPIIIMPRSDEWAPQQGKTDKSGRMVR